MHGLILYNFKRNTVVSFFVVLNNNDEDQYHEFRNKNGTLLQLYSRDQFTVSSVNRYFKSANQKNSMCQIAIVRYLSEVTFLKHVCAKVNSYQINMNANLSRTLYL